jgi:hypothetical protein
MLLKARQCGLTPRMSCREKWRSLCSSLCKGHAAFDCQLHPFVRRRRVDRDEMTFDYLPACHDPTTGSAALAPPTRQSTTLTPSSVTKES